MSAQLFDPAQGPTGGWPPAARLERAYLEGFATQGSQGLIANLRTRVIGARHGERILPTTVNAAEYGDAYVCLPHTAYALYAKAELALVDAGPWTPALSRLADLAGAVLKAARINRIVHLDNWMLSTNLHGDWRGEGLAALRRTLVEAYPGHFLAVRSINAWSDPDLAAALVEDGWSLVPSRQVWVVEDLARDWAARTDTRRDRRLLARSGLVLDDLARLRPGDAERIAELYAQLYLQRYSSLNPAFTPAFVALTHAAGVLLYRGLRDVDGRLSAVVGCLARGGVATAPIVGYDISRPQAEGLYRMTSVLVGDLAQALGVRLNNSAGAAAFKRHRGARPVIEYSAVFADHLSRPRRAALGGLRQLLNRVAVPLMQARGL